MKRREPEKPRWVRILAGVGYFLFLFVIFAAATIAGWVRQSPILSKSFEVMLDPGKGDPKRVFGKDSTTLLILGCDSDYTTGGGRITRKYSRSDMMLVAKLDFAGKRITGVSIPRDTECRLPGYKLMKINAYHAITKESQADDMSRQAVEHLLPGVKIDRVVTLDFQAFQNLIDIIGGVTVNVEKRMVYQDKAGHLDIDLRAGTQKLDGNKAMGFVRFRHDDNDFKRQERQKQFLLAVKQEVLKTGNLASLPQIVEQGKKVLNGALNDDEIIGLVTFAKGVGQDSIKLGQIPIIERKRSTFLAVDEDKLPQVLAEYGLIPSYQARLGN